MSEPARENPRPVPITHLRVAVIGDSLAYGAGDESRRGIPGWLTDELRRLGIESPEAVNLGVNGATTRDVAQRLESPGVRRAITAADAVVLSVGANDLFETPEGRDEAMRAPLVVANRMLERVAGVVATIRRINPDAKILLLGGYNPVPRHPYARLIDWYLGIWDSALEDRFESDPAVAVVRMSDLVNGWERLSSHDRFHPGRDAYRDTAHRIALMLVNDRDTT
jgi:lysophospholipase L1-like esterase